MQMTGRQRCKLNMAAVDRHHMYGITAGSEGGKSGHLGAQDDVLGCGRSVPLEAIAVPLPVELPGERDAEAKRVLIVDGHDVGQGPRGARRSVDLVAGPGPPGCDWKNEKRKIDSPYTAAGVGGRNECQLQGGRLSLALAI